MTNSFKSAASARPSGRTLHVSLWIVQVSLALMFGLAGVMKATMPLDTLAQSLPWVTDVPGALVRFIGLSEAAGALGLLVPALARVRPWLTPLAGLGLSAVMILATAFHLQRGEVSHSALTASLAGLAAFVAWGRFRRAPIEPRAPHRRSQGLPTHP
jgi:putative oxidoreductase